MSLEPASAPATCWAPDLRPVAVLFVRPDSNYKALSGVDVWDAERDARNWTGGCPVVAHPPCRGWGRLRHMASPVPGERQLALLAVDLVREWGGVVEHPDASLLWKLIGAKPGVKDQYGGWLLPIHQHSWGHKAEKKTMLYIVGCAPRDVPDMPMVLGEAGFLCGTSGRRRDGTRLKPGDAAYRPEISKAEREHTPRALTEWLVDLARRCAMVPNAAHQPRRTA